MDALPALLTGRLYLLIHPHPTAHGTLLQLAASLAGRGPLLVLDGGNCFNVYPVARALRRYSADVEALLGHIRVARAFTCFQMAALLFQAQASSTPALVLNLLETFYDENVPLGERQRLLGACLPHLRRLCQAAPVLVSARPGEPRLLERLTDAADEVWSAQAPPALPPLRLLPE